MNNQPNLYFLLAAFESCFDADTTLATRKSKFLCKTDQERLFEASLEVTARVVEISVFGMHSNKSSYVGPGSWQASA